MNRIHRRLFRAFLEAGGEAAGDDEFEHFVRQVEATVLTLAPKTRSAVECALHACEASGYEEVARLLAEREGVAVSPSALRQRISRGIRALEQTIRAQRRAQLDRNP